MPSIEGIPPAMVGSHGEYISQDQSIPSPLLLDSVLLSGFLQQVTLEAVAVNNLRDASNYNITTSSAAASSSSMNQYYAHANDHVALGIRSKIPGGSNDLSVCLWITENRSSSSRNTTTTKENRPTKEDLHRFVDNLNHPSGRKVIQVPGVFVIEFDAAQRFVQLEFFSMKAFPCELCLFVAMSDGKCYIFGKSNQSMEGNAWTLLSKFSVFNSNNNHDEIHCMLTHMEFYVHQPLDKADCYLQLYWNERYRPKLISNGSSAHSTESHIADRVSACRLSLLSPASVQRHMTVLLTNRFSIKTMSSSIPNLTSNLTNCSGVVGLNCCNVQQQIGVWFVHREYRCSEDLCTIYFYDMITGRVLQHDLTLARQALGDDIAMPWCVSISSIGGNLFMYCGPAPGDGGENEGQGHTSRSAMIHRFTRRSLLELQHLSLQYDELLPPSDHQQALGTVGPQQCSDILAINEASMLACTTASDSSSRSVLLLKCTDPIPCLDNGDCMKQSSIRSLACQPGFCLEWDKSQESTAAKEHKWCDQGKFWVASGGAGNCRNNEGSDSDRLFMFGMWSSNAICSLNLLDDSTLTRTNEGKKANSVSLSSQSQLLQIGTWRQADSPRVHSSRSDDAHSWLPSIAAPAISLATSFSPTVDAFVEEAVGHFNVETRRHEMSSTSNERVCDDSFIGRLSLVTFLPSRRQNGSKSTHHCVECNTRSATRDLLKRNGCLRHARTERYGALACTQNMVMLSQVLHDCGYSSLDVSDFISRVDQYFAHPERSAVDGAMSSGLLALVSTLLLRLFAQHPCHVFDFVMALQCCHNSVVLDATRGDRTDDSAGSLQFSADVANYLLSVVPTLASQELDRNGTERQNCIISLLLLTGQVELAATHLLHSFKRVASVVRLSCMCALSNAYLCYRNRRNQIQVQLGNVSDANSSTSSSILQFSEVTGDGGPETDDIDSWLHSPEDVGDDDDDEALRIILTMQRQSVSSKKDIGTSSPSSGEIADRKHNNVQLFKKQRQELSERVFKLVFVHCCRELMLATNSVMDNNKSQQLLWLQRLLSCTPHSMTVDHVQQLYRHACRASV
jgi:hypothetical protein